MGGGGWQSTRRSMCHGGYALPSRLCSTPRRGPIAGCGVPSAGEHIRNPLLAVGSSRGDRRLARRSRRQMVRVEASEWRAEADLHRDLATALDFPDYYGRNLDALNDCMRDDVASYEYGSSQQETGLVLVLLRYDALAARCPRAAHRQRPRHLCGPGSVSGADRAPPAMPRAVRRSERPLRTRGRRACHVERRRVAGREKAPGPAARKVGQGDHRTAATRRCGCGRPADSDVSSARGRLLERLGWACDPIRNREARGSGRA